jgi:hypothetical protein
MWICLRRWNRPTAIGLMPQGAMTAGLGVELVSCIAMLAPRATSRLFEPTSKK